MKRAGDVLGTACVLALGTLGALLALGTAAHPLAAQTVAGRVLDDTRGSPVSGAVVRLLDPKDKEKAQAMTDSLGRFTLAPPEDGKYVMVVERLGYETTRSPLFAMHVGGDPVPLDLMMTPAPLGVEGLEVSVEEEAADLLGQVGLTPRTLGKRWIDRKFIESVQVKTNIGSAIRWKNVPGVTVHDEASLSPSKTYDPENGLSFCILVAGVNSGCALLVLNGTVVSGEQIALMDPDAFEAVAILKPAEATTFYGTQGGWGAVLFWTRRAGEGGGGE